MTKVEKSRLRYARLLDRARRHVGQTQPLAKDYYERVLDHIHEEQSK